ncbi:MAG: hypothetical protein CMJ38_03330 [Phycisphaerae bacterium]|nr:hypothetical protein [Phycisphaerae bacterium]
MCCVASEVWHVPTECKTIQAAIDAASDGDEVLVAKGTYVECIDFSGKTISIRSESGAKYTIIDGQEKGTVVSCVRPSSAIMEGFSIVGGAALVGGGIRIENATPIIRSCMIEFNEAGEGGGAYVSAGTPQFDNCVFSFNVADDGDGIWCVNAKPLITACIFAGDSIGYKTGEMITIRDTNSDFGACCIGETCVQTASVACYEAGGFFRGEDERCLDACPETCDEDVNEDRRVNMTDLLRVIGAFGYCP